MDGQSLHGKAPVGLARMAKRHGVPVVAFAGAVGEDAERLQREGFAAVLPIVDGPIPLEEAMRRGGELLERSVYRFFRERPPSAGCWTGPLRRKERVPESMICEGDFCQSSLTTVFRPNNVL